MELYLHSMSRPIRSQRDTLSKRINNPKEIERIPSKNYIFLELIEWISVSQITIIQVQVHTSWIREIQVNIHHINKQITPSIHNINQIYKVKNHSLIPILSDPSDNNKKIYNFKILMPSKVS